MSAMRARKLLGGLAALSTLAGACSSGGEASGEGSGRAALANVQEFLSTQPSASWLVETESRALWSSLVDEGQGFQIVVPGIRHEVIRAEVRADLTTDSGGSRSEWVEMTWEAEPLPHIPFVDAYVSEDRFFTRGACSATELEDAEWLSVPLTDADRASPRFASPGWFPAVVGLLDEPTVTGDGGEVVLEQTFTVADGERTGPWPLYGLPAGTPVIVRVTATDSGEIVDVEVSTPGEGLRENDRLEACDADIHRMGRRRARGALVSGRRGGLHGAGLSWRPAVRRHPALVQSTARGGGLEPPITGPEPVVLPITPPPKVETVRLARRRSTQGGGRRPSCDEDF